MMKVRSVMAPYSYFSIDGSWSVCEVAKFFKSIKSDFLQVANEGRFLGILTRDQFEKQIQDRKLCYRRMSQLSILSLMDNKQPYCEPDEPISKAYELMRTHKLEYLPVRRLEDLVGVIKLSSVSSAMLVC